MPRKMAGIRKPKFWSCCELAVERPVGHLEAPRDRPDPSVRVQDAVEAGDGLVHGCARHHLEGHVVEAAFHVEGGPEGPAVHPEDAESVVVGDQLARRDDVHVLGGEAEAHDPELPPAAVDEGGDTVAGLQAVGVREDLAGDHLVGTARLDPATPPQEHVVETGPPFVRDGDEPSGRGLLEAGHVQRHVGHHAQIRASHAGDGGDPVSQPQRRPLAPGEHVREAEALVVRALGAPEGIEGREVRHVHRHAGGHHGRDGQRLALHLPEVPEQLAVEGGDPHGLTTRAPAGGAGPGSARCRRCGRRRGGSPGWTWPRWRRCA